MPRFKKGDRVLCKGWSRTKDFIAVVEKRSCSGASYAVRSELPLYDIAGHQRGLRLQRHYYGYVSANDVREATVLDELAQIGREPVEVLPQSEGNYVWTVAVGQRGTVEKVIDDETVNQQYWVQFDNFYAAKGGWFDASEIGHLNALDQIVESI